MDFVQQLRTALSDGPTSVGTLQSFYLKRYDLSFRILYDGQSSEDQQF